MLLQKWMETIYKCSSCHWSKYLIAPVLQMTADPHLTSGGRRCVHYDSVAALRVLVQMLSEFLKLEVGGVGQDTYVVALTFA